MQTVSGDLLSRSAEALRFPAYFGHNWDAFEECLNDMSWEAEGPALLLLDHAGRFAAALRALWTGRLSARLQAAIGRNGSPRLGLDNRRSTKW